ncbi:MAG: hypothetical protein ACLSV2_08105 [Clostridium sp.]
MNYHVYLKNAFVAIGEVDSTFIGGQSTEKSAELKSDLMKERKKDILLSFKEIWKKSKYVMSSNFMQGFKH